MALCWYASLASCVPIASPARPSQLSPSCLANSSFSCPQVKTQFGNKPHIYNKFLEIMKAFQAET